VNLNAKIRYRLNYQIRVPQVRVNFDNQQLGIMSTEQARQLAHEKGLDIIEVMPNTNPPVCCIADYGKLIYEAKLREKEFAKKQCESVQHIKEIRLTPTIASHDVEYKSKNIEKFLLEGYKVQLMMKFTPRELNHKDIGYGTINSIVEKFQESAVVEVPPRFNGRMLFCVLSPKRK